MSKIAAGKYVELDFVLTDEEGDVLQRTADEGVGPLCYVHGYSPILAGLHNRLEGLSQGEQASLVVPPSEAYGDVDEEAIFEVPRSELPNPKDVKFGDELEAEDDEGNVIDMHVVDVRDDIVVMDANHPLAGITLTWAVTIKNVRDATKDEIDKARAESAELEAGHEHGPGCTH